MKKLVTFGMFTLVMLLGFLAIITTASIVFSDNSVPVWMTSFIGATGLITYFGGAAMMSKVASNPSEDDMEGI